MGVISLPMVSSGYYKQWKNPSLSDYQSAEAWNKVKHLSVSPRGYRHIKNKANEGYRKAEFEVWKAAAKGADKITIDFIWSLYSKTLHRLNTQLENLAKRKGL